ncbi:GNAT family N-acetyltransferase [Streptomyces sp. NPDC058872]|uniref:GNAT family N-acetyltransferase n=1 Tax=Streptomyces sp. NPDC058872 TaxID=3346661 RepID=UPI00367D811E
MTWHFTGESVVFRRAAARHLATEAVRNTAVLSLLDRPGRFGWWVEPDGRVTGVLAVSPSGVLDLGATTEGAAGALLFPTGEEPTTVRGETAAVRAYAEASGGPWEPATRMRLFRLDGLTPPDPAPVGRARVASAADAPLVTAWTAEFASAIGEQPAADYTDFVAERIAEGRLWLWTEPEGGPVSMAAVSRTIEGQARVHLVYTPPAERGRGYAAGATEAVSRAALDGGVARVLLFTDLANPTSNALYQRLGYRPVTDHLVVERSAVPA